MALNISISFRWSGSDILLYVADIHTYVCYVVACLSTTPLVLVPMFLQSGWGVGRYRALFRLDGSYLWVAPDLLDRTPHALWVHSRLVT